MTFAVVYHKGLLLGPSFFLHIIAVRIKPHIFGKTYQNSAPAAFTTVKKCLDSVIEMVNVTYIFSFFHKVTFLGKQGFVHAMIIVFHSPIL